MEAIYNVNLSAKDRNYSIEGDEYKHLKVLRLQRGEEVVIINGQGLRARAICRDYDNKSYKLEIIDCEQLEQKRKITLALGVLDNRDRFEFALEKAIELGISKFVPLRCDFSQKAKANLSRLEAKAIAAIKQSKQAWKCEIDEEISFQKFIENNLDKQYILLDADASRASIESIDINNEVILLVGPEGGFSPKELLRINDLANHKKWKLGENRLRAETAAIAGISTLNFLLD